MLGVVKTRRLLGSMIFGGSYVTGKETPNDVDLLLEITPEFAASCLVDPQLVRLFDHKVTEPYGVQAKPWVSTAREHINLLVLFQTPSPDDLKLRGMSPEDRKGVIQVP